jgi:hypothetical protein
MKFYHILLRTLLVEFAVAFGLSWLLHMNVLLCYLFVDLVLQKIFMTENARREEIAMEQYQSIINSMNQLKGDKK